MSRQNTRTPALMPAKNSKKIEKIHEILETNSINKKHEDQCRNIKNKIAMYWSRQLAARKKAYWHYHQNSSKSAMYSKWSTEYPDFIPLKFRPKLIHNESPEAAKIRLNQARARYHDDINLLKVYASSHEQKFTSIDQDVNKYLENLSSVPEEVNILKDWWLAETSRCEHYSIQLWYKKEAWFEKKKSEELNNGEYEFSGNKVEDRPKNSPMTENRRTNAPYPSSNSTKRNQKNSNKNRRNRGRSDTQYYNGQPPRNTTPQTSRPPSRAPSYGYPQTLHEDGLNTHRSSMASPRYPHSEGHYQYNRPGSPQANPYFTSANLTPRGFYNDNPY